VIVLRCGLGLPKQVPWLSNPHAITEHANIVVAWPIWPQACYLFAHPFGYLNLKAVPGRYSQTSNSN
jgi:hypothetical protein